MNERNRYKTVQQMVNEIVEHLQAGGTVTLALDSKWWAKRKCSPYEGRIAKDAILYSTDFNTNQVMEALEKQGYYFKAAIGLSLCFGYVEAIPQIPA